MKKSYYVISLILVSACLAGQVLAQESDHEIQSGFTAKYDHIGSAVNNATSINQIDSLKQEISALAQTYTPYSGLLDNALYPASYRSQMDGLISKVNAAEQRLLIIENQSERLADLGQEVTRFKNEIARFNVRTDSLRNAIARASESESRLSALVQNYRKSLENRDALIVSVIDSLLMTYKGMTPQKMNEIGRNVTAGHISGSENPLPMISSILDENIEYATSNTETLPVEDHLRIYTVQKHFNEVWNQIGPKMIEVYGGNKKEQWARSISQKMKDWRMLASQQMWNSMDEYLEYSNVQLGAFDNNYSFFVALDNFVKHAQEKSKSKILASDSYDDYKKFQAFWSGKIKNEWSNLVQDSEVLTVSQISTIDEQLNSWEAEARPVHPLMIALAVITIVALAGFGMAMFKTTRV